MSKETEEPFPGPNCYVGTPAERLDRMEHKIDRVYTAMLGDERMGNPGWAVRLNTVEKVLTQIATERAAEANAKRGAMWVVGIAAGAIGAFGALIGTAVKSIFGNGG